MYMYIYEYMYEYMYEMLNLFRLPYPSYVSRRLWTMCSMCGVPPNPPMGINVTFTMSNNSAVLYDSNIENNSTDLMCLWVWKREREYKNV